MRRFVLGIGFALITLALFFRHPPGALIAWGIILVAGILIENYHYKPELPTPPGPGWQKTNETSVSEHGIVTVWFNPATGERAYVREGGR